MSDLISIIIPVYNVENYLEKCIESVINQTYKRIQIIIINDGSTDGSLNICKKYQEQDCRICLITQKNMGLSAARNSGIKLAEGDYIFFVDSDDWIENDTIETLYKTIISMNVDIAVCGVTETDGVIGDKICKEDAKIKLSNYESLDMLIYDGNKIGITVWNKLYRKTLFNQIIFEEGRINEDVYFTPRILYYAKNIYIDTTPKYNYRTNRKGSICNKKLDKSNLDGVEGYLSDFDFFIKRGEDRYAFEFLKKAFGYCRFLYFSASRYGQKSARKLFYKFYRTIYFKYMIILLRNGDKVFLIHGLLFLIFPQMLYFVWAKIRKRAS